MKNENGDLGNLIITFDERDQKESSRFLVTQENEIKDKIRSNEMKLIFQLFEDYRNIVLSVTTGFLLNEVK